MSIRQNMNGRQTKKRKGLSGEAFCKRACPAGINVPRYVQLVNERKYAEALNIIREKVPFPAVLGRVCPNPCENECRRSEVDKPVAIRSLKRFVTDQNLGLSKKYFNAGPYTGKRLAIVGSGPAGLTAAYYLRKLGHGVTIFEALPVVGGMMRTGIPEFRLPRDLLNKEIDQVKSIGFEIKTKTRIESLDELLEGEYDAVLLAMGAHRGHKLMVEGEDSPGVVDGVSFLRDINLADRPNLGNTVAVIGGGNVALDSARSAIRFGCREVNLIYRRTRDEMPAGAEDISAALYEGVRTTFLAAPERIVRKDGKLSLSLISIGLGEPDATGRLKPVPIKGSGFSMDCDSVVVAIGQTPDIPGQFSLKIGAGNTIQVDPDTLATSREGVFACGDVVTGPAYVIDAIAAARRAAGSIDRYLGGTGNIEKDLPSTEGSGGQHFFEEGILQKRRQPMPLLNKAKRLTSFAEVESGFSEEAAIEESSRCLRCDRQVEVIVAPGKCTECYRCQMICSIVYKGAFNPEKARIQVDLPEISWKDECIGGCSLCIQNCLSEAISFN